MTQVTSGAVLVGKYRLESLIGRGGMGSVWRAEHLGLNAPVAVKLLDFVDFTGGADSLGRFHREARAAAAIRSPHVVQIFDHGFDEAIGTPFIVMELMDGESLAQRLTRVGRISPAEVARVFTQVGRALTRAHEAGIVHRDLKPDNVFLVRNEDEEVAKVLDFGIAKAHGNGLGSDSATRTGAVMGTAYYMSPEQISGAKTVDFRTDLWAFGVMACECLTGTRPFDAETIGGLTLRICVEPIPAPSSFAAVPAGFDAWFSRVASREPAQRFGSAREAADSLRVLCTAVGAPLHSPPPPPSRAVAEGIRTLGTAAPLSRSARDWESTPPQRSARRLPLVVGGIAVAVAASVLSLRHSDAKHAASDAGPLPSESSAGPVLVASSQTPSAVCESDSTQCAGTTLEACVAGQWVKSGTIKAGQCGALCTPGSSTCNGLAPQTCDSTGKWLDDTPCTKPESCRAGKCTTQKQSGKTRPPVVMPPTPPIGSIKPDCDPPYSLDAQGQKHFKPECYK